MSGGVRLRSSILLSDHPAGLTRIPSDYCIITAPLPGCLLRVREDGPHMDAIMSTHRLQALLTLFIQRPWLKCNGTGASGWSLLPTVDNKQYSHIYRQLTKHSNSRAGRAITIKIFRTSCLINASSPLSERSWAYEKAMNRKMIQRAPLNGRENRQSMLIR